MQYIQSDTEGWDLRAYLRYVEEHRQHFPAGARDFVAQKWRYDRTDHRCPHDAWLENLAIREASTGERKERRTVEIAAVFLGAYHDGTFELTYEGVTNYALGFSRQRVGLGHGDWIVDELILDESGAVVHEIQFAEGVWTIVCADIRHRWQPSGR